jgi:nicotinamide-nucleotide amidase
VEVGDRAKTGEADRRAEMIFSGDELLRGDIVNTNQSYLGERLLDLSIFATHALSVTDDLSAMVTAIRDSLARSPVILVLSGGLGPTEDDLTREAAAEALGRPLEHHEDLLEQIRERFESRGVAMGDVNRKQALIPRGASVIPLTGTAPGFWVWQGGTLVVALPGVPWELKEMWEGVVEPLLRESPSAESTGDGAGDVAGPGNGAGAGAGGAAGAADVAGAPSTTGQTVRRIRTYGIGESTAAELLSEFDWHGADAAIGTRAAIDGLTIILRGAATPEGHRKLDAIQDRMLAILGERVYGVGGAGLPEIAGAALRKAGLTVAVAESCTGGLLGKRLTDLPGSSDYFLGGVTAYDNRVKIEVLGVPAGLLAQFGAVSEETAAAMAEGASRLMGADCALSTTGIAGPDGGSDEKPVGLVYVGSVVDGVTVVERLMLWGRRDQIRERAAYSALDLLRRRLLRRTAAR